MASTELNEDIRNIERVRQEVGMVFSISISSLI